MRRGYDFMTKIGGLAPFPRVFYKTGLCKKGISHYEVMRKAIPLKGFTPLEKGGLY